MSNQIQNILTERQDRVKIIATFSTMCHVFYVIAAFDMAVGIEPTPACRSLGAGRSILCLGKMWRKIFPAQGRGERQSEAHNQGGSPHISKYKPWILVTYLAFSD